MPPAHPSDEFTISRPYIEAPDGEGTTSQADSIGASEISSGEACEAATGYDTIRRSTNAEVKKVVIENLADSVRIMATILSSFQIGNCETACETPPQL
jgi:hypothetical protein